MGFDNPTNSRAGYIFLLSAILNHKKRQKQLFIDQGSVKRVMRVTAKRETMCSSSVDSDRLDVMARRARRQNGGYDMKQRQRAARHTGVVTMRL